MQCLYTEIDIYVLDGVHAPTIAHWGSWQEVVN